MNKIVLSFFVLMVAMLVSCAGERQGLVCEEMEYRLNTQTYSPDQRAYMEEELRVCREDEAQKKNAEAKTRKSIYDRYAVDTTKSSAQDVSVSEALKDSSGEKTVSIRDRYENVAPAPAESQEPKAEPNEVPADTSASDLSNFQ